MSRTRRAAACCLAVLMACLTPLSAASAQQAGTLVSADPVRETPAGMQAWRVTYWTAREDRVLQRVTGMVVAPREAMPREPRRVIAWAHGTSGVAQRCALSTNPAFFSATPALGEMVRRGYVVVAPDYPGLGSPMPHPYLVGGDTARSVIDAVRAARGISGAAAGDRFAVWGESQGGHAALWTAAETARYAPELELVGTAAAAPPTDLAANFRADTDPNVAAMLTAFATYSWSRRFDAPLSTLGNRNLQGVITRLARNNCIELDATPRIGTILGVAVVRNAFKDKDLAAMAPWDEIIRRNSVDPLTMRGPVLIAQSEGDRVVAPAVTETFARSLCRSRAALRWISLPGGNHATSAADSAIPTLDWIGARFAGKPPANDCAALPSG